MQVENQIRAGVEPPAHIVRRGFDERTGLPKQEVGIWFERVRARLGRDRIHARETWLATLSVATAERLLAVDPDIRVVYHTLVAGPQFDCTNILRLPQIGGDDKIPKDLAVARRELVRLGYLHSQIRRTHLPPFCETRQRRQIGGVAFGRALSNPFSDETKLSAGEAAFAIEISVPWLREPWWHISALGNQDNLCRMLAYVLVVEKREWRRVSGAVTWRAKLKDQRGDVLIEANRFRRERQHGQEKCDPSHCRFSIAQPAAIISSNRRVFSAARATNASINGAGRSTPIRALPICLRIPASAQAA